MISYFHLSIIFFIESVTLLMCSILYFSCLLEWNIFVKQLLKKTINVSSSIPFLNCINICLLKLYYLLESTQFIHKFSEFDSVLLNGKTVFFNSWIKQVRITYFNILSFNENVINNILKIAFLRAELLRIIYYDFYYFPNFLLLKMRACLFSLHQL